MSAEEAANTKDIDTTTSEIAPPNAKIAKRLTNTAVLGTDQSVKPVDMDPFQNQRDAEDDPFAEQKEIEKVAGGEDMAMDTSPTDNRRMSKEWGKSSHLICTAFPPDSQSFSAR
jgi:hypothetical protein